MKNILKCIGLVALIGFSFFYTDRVIEVIREEDEIMIELQDVEDIYKIDPIDATILDDTIIPGLNGRKIDIDKSYLAMKEKGAFNHTDIVYDTILPDVSIVQNKDKFITMGNNNKQMVSLLFLLDDDQYMERVEKVLNEKDVVGNYFVDYNYLIDNSTKIKTMKNREFYSYGDNGKYTPDNLLFSNNLISRIRDNNAIYCLVTSQNKDILQMCSRNDLYTIFPNIIVSSRAYKEVKDNLISGSIILFSIDKNTTSELGVIIDYILGKGLKIGGLSELLSEEL